MKSAVENLNPTRVKLTVEVPFEELKPSLDAAYKLISAQIQVPGFRKGKVPARIIDQRVGRGAVLQEAVNEALPRFYGEAVEQADVRPLGQPEVDVTEAPLHDGEQLRFTAEVDVRPPITLPDLAGIAVEVDPVAVDADSAEVREELDALRARFATVTGVDRPATAGDLVSIDLGATVGEATVDEATGLSYEVGSDTMLDGLDEALEGMSSGDTATFPSTLAGGEYEGQSAQVTVTVQSVKQRQLPELDDEFAQLASEFDTLEELKTDLLRRTERMLRYEQGAQARDRLLEHLLTAADFPVPDGVIQAEVHAHLEGEDRLEDDVHRAEVEEETRTALRRQLLLDAIAEQEKVSVGQQEVIQYLVLTAQQHGVDPGAYAKAVDEGGQIAAIVAEVARRKALAVVLDKAVVTDTEGNPVDLKALDVQAERAQGAAQPDADDAAADDADGPRPAPE